MRLLLGAALALALAPAAQAKPVSLPYSEEFLAIAYGSGHALVAEPEPYGAKAIVIRDLDFAHRSDDVLLEIPYSGGEPHVALAANGTGYLAAVNGHVVLGGYDGSQRALLDCGATLPVLAAGGSGFAVGGEACGTVIVGADGTLTPVATTGMPDDLAYAEPYLALRFGEETFVRNLATGAERQLDAEEPESLSVASDGTLLAMLEEGLYAWPPGARDPDLLSNRGAGDVAVSGTRVVFDTLSVPRVAALGGGAARALSLPGVGLAGVLGFDGTHAAFQSFSCRSERQVVQVDVDAPRKAGQIGECPVRIAATGLRFSHAGRASARVSCPNGCRAKLLLIAQSTEQDPCGGFDETGGGAPPCPTIATARLDLPASRDRRPVAFRLTADGRRLRGRRLDVHTSELGGLGLTFEGEISRAVLA